MNSAHVNRTEDLNYKSGFVQCACGWRKELGNGFDGYHIDQCPKCCPALTTRSQRKVTTGNPKGRNLTVQLGHFTYFVLSNGIHVQYAGHVMTTHNGLSESEADRL